MTDTPKWVKDLAEHIFQNYVYNIGYDRKREGCDITIGEETIQVLESIILKYYPDDKGVELLKVSRRLSEWVRGLAGECLKDDVRKLLEDFEAALADYEANK